jgi:transcriptional regulator with XRE-family HTH domain
VNSPKKTIDKEMARKLRTELYDAVNRGELSLQNTVKQMRKISRLTQTEFAVHRGLSPRVIKEIERGIGNPTVNTLNRIGQFFGLEVAFVRSKKLQAQEGGLSEVQGSYQAAGIESASTQRSPLEDARRLIEQLERIKQLAAPPGALREVLNAMASDLNVIHEAKQFADQTEAARALTSANADVRRAMPAMRAELNAVREAQTIIDSAEKIQRQIEPPPELMRWLADIEAANKLLRPLEKSLHSMSPRLGRK